MASLTPSKLYNSKNQELDDVAIDFRKLLKEEKKRAREKLRQKSTNTADTTADADGKNAANDGKDAANPENTNNTTTTSDTTLKDWPIDWLTTQSSPPQPFTPDYASTKPATILYKSNILSETQQTQLEKWLQSLPESTNTQQDILGSWNTMKYAKRRVAMFENKLPLPLQQLADWLVLGGIFKEQDKPNHVLVNEYSASQGILPHTDGPLYLSTTATFSIGNSVLLNFKKRLSTRDIGMVEDPVELQVLLESGSLVVFTDDAYTQYCHGIDDVWVEYASMQCLNAKEETRVSRGHRISLTFRHTLKE